ncbi:MAG: T9SS type A sorting domain-containing protein, partial [Croceitalea sp.]|nr:T9SS type A sorting domain-containing protein [Croceitalea sp.]
NNPTLDAGIFLPRASLGDTVFLDENQNGIQDDGEAGVEGVVVNLLDCDGNQLDTTTTDGNGNYGFADLDPNVDYIVEFVLPDGGFVFSPVDASGDDATDSDAGADGRTPCTDLAPGENNPTLDAGIFLPRASLGDTVFLDENQNGIQDDGEAGVEGVVVNLLDCDGNQLDTTTTDGNGNYGFADLDPNVDYIVEFVLPTGYERSPANQGGDDATDSDAGADGRTPCTDLAPGENNTTLDAGVFLPCDITPVVTPVDPICLGETVTLTASGGDQFQWKANGEILDGETNAELTVTPEVTTMYSVIVTDTSQFECFAEASIEVTVNPLPEVSVPDVTVCANETATLTATSATAVSFLWSNGETTESIVVTESGDYTVTVTDANGCEDMATATATINPLPEVTLEGGTICAGESFILEALSDTAEAYFWTGFAAQTSTLTVTPQVTTDYTVTVRDANGCFKEATATVTVTPQPEVNAGDDVMVCAGDLVTLTATATGDVASEGYVWSNGATGPSIVVRPSATTTYTVTVTSSENSSCTAMDEVVVTVNPKPEVSVSDVTVCSDEMATLTATSATAVEYNWSNGDEGTTIVVNPQETTTYSVTVTDANGCEETAMATVTVTPEPAPVVTDVTICSDESYTWSVNGVTYDGADGSTSLTIEGEDCAADQTLNLTVDTKLSIGDFVFDDVNRNGVQDGEAGVPGITVSLYECGPGSTNTGGTFVESTVTDAGGFYNFEVCPGSGPYYLEFSLPDGFEFTTKDAADDTFDSDVNSDGVTDCINVIGDNPTVDAGIRLIDTCGADLANKILPRDPPGFYDVRDNDTACLGDQLYFWVFRDINLLRQFISDDFTGWTFTWEFANGEVVFQDGSNTVDPNRIHVTEGRTLEVDDFGEYKVTWTRPDGCTGQDVFVLSRDGGCLPDGTRPSAFNQIADAVPNPSVSGGLLTIEINTINGSVESDIDTNSIKARAVMIGAQTESISVGLYDMSGRMVSSFQKFNTYRGRDVIDYQLPNVETGTYILKVIGDDWSDTSQIIIK